MERYKAAHSSKEDVALAVDKAHEAFQTWGKTSAERSILLNKIAQVIEII
jgi:aldehyde dehydrogenase